MNQTTLASLTIAVGLVVAAFIFADKKNIDSATPKTRTFNVVMENNRYNPSTIRVNLGDTVVLKLENRDTVAHAVEIPDFGVSLPGGHLQPGQKATLTFLANKKTKVDAAVCGGLNPTDKTDDHGEELIIEVL